MRMKIAFKIKLNQSKINVTQKCDQVIQTIQCSFPVTFGSKLKMQIITEVW